MNETDIEMKILEYCKNADPIELGHKLGIEPREVFDFLEKIHYNKELRELLVMMMFD